MEAVKYFEERDRMLKSLGKTDGVCSGVKCDSCPLNEKNLGCILRNVKSVEIVEKWSKENPQKTIMQDFLEKYPNAVMYDGRPSGVCPFSLGYEKTKEKPCWNELYLCIDCWNRPLEG